MGLLLNYENCSNNEYFSHRVTLQTGEKHDVRLMVKIEQTETLIDPLDFRYENGVLLPLPQTSTSALGVF